MNRIELHENSRVDRLQLDALQIQALANSDAFELRADRGSPGDWCIHAKQFVGVAQFGDLEIRVIPKVGVRRLVDLLTGSHERIRWDESIAPDLGESPDVAGVIATVFTNEATAVLGQGLLQGYKQLTDALPTVRGRMLVGAQLSRRCGLPLPVELTFDEFSPDVQENQLLAGAVRQLLRLRTVSKATRTQLRRLDQGLRDVTPTLPSGAPPEVEFTRLNERYRLAIVLARLVLKACSLEETGAGQQGIGFLVDMNRVFENVAGEGLRPHIEIEGQRLELQASLPLDADHLLTIRPDILVRSASSAVVAVGDVKYKQPDLKSVKTGDIYQAVVYAKRFGLSRVCLIYASPPPFNRLTIGDVDVHLTWLDLETDVDERTTQLASIAATLGGQQ